MQKSAEVIVAAGLPVGAAQQYVAEGRRVVVDMDLEKFFDRVNHDLLMQKLSTKIGDGRVLRLIRRYLEAGMMADGASHMNHAFPKSFFDRLGLVSLLDTMRRLQCVQ